jgi:hypothetical protein
MTVDDSGRRHDKALCGGLRRDGGSCTRPAGWGTTHAGVGSCKLHAGSTPNGRRSAEKTIAAQAVVTYGLPREIDPRDALLEEVHRTAGAVAYLAERVRALDERELVWGVTEKSEQRATEFPGTNVKREAKPNVWRQMLLEERKHLVDVCRVAVAAGIEERRVRLAESMGLQMAQILRGVLDGLGLTSDQRARVPGLLSAHLPLPAAGSNGGVSDG